MIAAFHIYFRASISETFPAAASQSFWANNLVSYISPYFNFCRNSVTFPLHFCYLSITFILNFQHWGDHSEHTSLPLTFQFKLHFHNRYILVTFPLHFNYISNDISNYISSSEVVILSKQPCPLHFTRTKQGSEEIEEITTFWFSMTICLCCLQQDSLK